MMMMRVQRSGFKGECSSDRWYDDGVRYEEEECGVGRRHALSCPSLISAEKDS